MVCSQARDATIFIAIGGPDAKMLQDVCMETHHSDKREDSEGKGTVIKGPPLVVWANQCHLIRRGTRQSGCRDEQIEPVATCLKTYGDS